MLRIGWSSRNLTVRSFGSHLYENGLCCNKSPVARAIYDCIIFVAQCTSAIRHIFYIRNDHRQWRHQSPHTQNQIRSISEVALHTLLHTASPWRSAPGAFRTAFSPPAWKVTYCTSNQLQTFYVSREASEKKYFALYWNFAKHLHHLVISWQNIVHFAKISRFAKNISLFRQICRYFTIFGELTWPNAKYHEINIFIFSMLPYVSYCLNRMIHAATPRKE